MEKYNIERLGGRIMTLAGDIFNWHIKHLFPPIALICFWVIVAIFIASALGWIP